MATSNQPGDPLDPHAAGAAELAATAFSELVELMARLRGPEGCPWDREQSHQSISLNLLEEAYETVDAIDRNDPAHLAEELGDVLLQVVFHAQMAAESGDFDITRVIEELIAKLITRHPHVFGDEQAGTPSEVLANWEAIKTREKPRDRISDGIPMGLPALVYAHKVLRRLAGAGKEYKPNQARLFDLTQQMESGPAAGVTGELLFEAAALAREHGIDPEGALRQEASRRLEE
ncbi:MAG: nucleoside triphosphate pyrophosphohydrolase [Actinomycetota bacterium]